jgi:hypothetical protein
VLTTAVILAMACPLDLARSIAISEAILSAGPCLRAAVYGPQSKGVGQWQLKHAMQGKFAAKKYYELVLGDYMHRARPRRGHVSCSLCWQLMQASAWMAAQELNQLINTVSERSTSAVATARFPDFVQQHWL